MKIIRRAINTFLESARGNIWFNLDDRQQKFISRKTVFNQKSSWHNLKLCRPCVNRLLVAGAVDADEGIFGEVGSEDFSPHKYLRTKVLTTNPIAVI